MGFHHVPVLYNETLELLNCEPGDIIVDGTLGGGGHASGILERIGSEGILIGIDRDPQALKATQKRLNQYGSSLITVHDNFVNLKAVLGRLSIPSIDGMVIDLGVSSHQLDEAHRGFSYHQDAPLDMRMDPSQSLDAHKVVNEYPQKELVRIIAKYGEEKWASRIATFIVDNRPIKTTGELTEIIKAAIPAKFRRQGPHPASRTFQAIRIEVNQELDNVERVLEDAVDMLKVGGRLCVISFHSLEDRIVKKTFQTMQSPCTCPSDFPICICKKEPKISVITRKPVIPGERELNDNPRSRSAKLRACQKS